MWSIFPLLRAHVVPACFIVVVDGEGVLLFIFPLHAAGTLGRVGWGARRMDSRWFGGGRLPV